MSWNCSITAAGYLGGAQSAGPTGQRQFSYIAIGTGEYWDEGTSRFPRLGTMDLACSAQETQSPMYREAKSGQIREQVYKDTVSWPTSVLMWRIAHPIA